MIPVSLLIADDHKIFREGLKMMLSQAPDIRFLGEAENGHELLELAASQQPDVVITDIKMPVMDGIEATKRLLKANPAIGVIALTMFDENHLIMEMLEAGALGYLLKNSDINDLLDAIHSVHQRQTYYCSQTSIKLAKLIASRREEGGLKKAVLELSDREKEIITLICEECTNKEISDRLYLSVRTIEGYRNRIMEKLQAKNTVGLVRSAIRLGLCKIENIPG